MAVVRVKYDPGNGVTGLVKVPQGHAEGKMGPTSIKWDLFKGLLGETSMVKG